MKLSNKLLIGLCILVIAASLAANISIKKNYDKADKNDFHWGYAKILEKPFRHIKIEGGNITQIAFEQNDKPSVRILRQWPGYEKGWVKAFVRGDTLFVYFPNEKIENAKIRDWTKHTTLLRIFAPELVSLEGIDTDFDLLKLNQKQITIDLSGNSETEVETTLSEIDSISVHESGLSSVTFETSPDYKGGDQIKVRAADINLNGDSRLHLASAQINSIKLNITDSARIELSGYSVKTIKK